MISCPLNGGTKMHIRHVILWEFMNNQNTAEKAKKIHIAYGQGVITDC